MERLKNSKWLEIIKWIWITAVFAAVTLYVVNNFAVVQSYFSEIHWSRFLVALVLIILGKQLAMFASRLTLEGERVKMNLWEFFSIYNLTQLGKYLPGGVWQYVGRYGTYRTKEMNAKSSLRAMLTEILWQISTAVLVGGIFLLSFNRGLLELIGLTLTRRVAVALMVGMILVWCAGMLVIQRYVQSLEFFDARLILRVAAYFLPAWVALGISFGMLFPNVDGQVLGIGIQGFTLSWAAGFAAFFTPGGLGVRELVMTALYSGTIYAAVVPVIASVHRVLWTLSELLVGLVIVIVQAFRKKTDHVPTRASEE
ncbi:MAG: hypothetical protein V2J07_05965 [Anaerolineae bacterium]|jgi:uncharacterized membrane protein YbhN (UPF0104 family)|nr:hypothetical protein [Anaerolineae bacterium]